MSFRVLVVEDDSVAAVEVREMMQDAGHEVVGVARSGDEAISLAQQTRPDAAIVDVKPPGTDGIETTRRLVEQDHLAVIVLTAHADPELISGAASAGAFAYLLKPVSKEALCANLEMAAARAAEFGELRREVDDIKTALEVRKLSERAKHVVMQRLGLGEEDAFTHLRQKCRNQNKTMREASEDILAADQAFMEVLSKDPPKKPVPPRDA